MYDDFYEPSEFDIMVEEFKDELRKSVKKEYQDKIADLEKRLAELTDIKQNWNKKTAELSAEKHKAQIAVAQAESNARKATLKELLEPLKKQMWGIRQEWSYIRDKCDKCDEDGYIHYKSPAGRDMKEECSCRKQKSVYHPVEAEVYEIDGREKRPGVRYVFQFEHTNLVWEWEDRFKRVDEIYDGRPFEEIESYYWMIFDDKDKAQEYCDYLNSHKKERT